MDVAEGREIEMQFTAAELRHLTRNPKAYVAVHRRQVEGQDGGNPQRPLFEAALRRYFRAHRSHSAARTHLEARVAASESDQRHANAASVGAMLDRFFELEAGGSEPEEYFPAARPGKVGNHILRLSPSLRYRLGDGYLVRHVWTEQDFSLRRPYTGLVAAAYCAHSEAIIGVGCIRQLDFWHVRTGKVAGWQARSLQLLVPSMEALLDAVATDLGHG